MLERALDLSPLELELRDPRGLEGYRDVARDCDQYLQILVGKDALGEAVVEIDDAEKLLLEEQGNRYDAPKTVGDDALGLVDRSVLGPRHHQGLFLRRYCLDYRGAEA